MGARKSENNDFVSLWSPKFVFPVPMKRIDYVSYIHVAEEKKKVNWIEVREVWPLQIWLSQKRTNRPSVWSRMSFLPPPSNRSP